MDRRDEQEGVAPSYSINIQSQNGIGGLSGGISATLPGGEVVTCTLTNPRLIVNGNIIPTHSLPVDTQFSIRVHVNMVWVNKSLWDATGMVICVTASDRVPYGVRLFDTEFEPQGLFNQAITFDADVDLVGHVSGYEYRMPNRNMNLILQGWWSGKDLDYNLGNGKPPVELW